MNFLLRLFLIGCLLANYTLPTAWAQSVRPARQKTANKLNQLEQQLQEASNNLAKTKNTNQIIQNRQQLQQLDAQKRAQQTQLQLEKDANKSLVLPNSSTRVDSSLRDVLEARFSQPQDTRYDTFLNKVRNNEITFAELIEYADPISASQGANAAATDARTVVVASEMIGNTLMAITPQEPEEVIAYMVDTLTVMQPRLLFQLYNLEKKYFTEAGGHRAAANAPAEAVMAIGSLRITLLKINQFFKRMNLENPVQFTQATNFKVAYEGNQAITQQQNPALTYTGPLNGQNATAAQNQPALHSTSAGLPNEPTNYIDPYAKMALKFENELRAYYGVFKADAGQSAWAINAPDNSPHYSNANLLAEYATFYAVHYGGDMLANIIHIFDTGSHRDGRNGPVVLGPYKTPGAPILNTIFTTLFETVRYAPIAAPEAKRAISLLTELSDKNHHDLPTVVFALEVASLLYQPHNNDYRSTQYTSAQQQEAQALEKQFYSFFKADPQARALFAARVAEIYCALKQTATPLYGLDSGEMEQLANKLADIYNNFYDIKSTVVSATGTNAHPHPQTACEITLSGNLNTRVRSLENTEEILIFAGECIFWAYLGGPAFAALGNAYRMARGAVAVLPKAARTFKTAAKVRKFNSFEVVQASTKGARSVRPLEKAVNTLEQGAKGSNFIKEAEKKGITFVRAVEGPDQFVKLKPVTSVRQLQGKNRWLPKKLNQETKDIFALQTKPNGEVAVAKLSDVNFFKGKTYDEFTLTAFEPVENSAPFESLTKMEARLGKQRATLMDAFTKTKPFDGYMPLKDGGYWNMAWGMPKNKDILLWDAAHQSITLVPRGSIPATVKPADITAEQLLASGGFEVSPLELGTGLWANKAVNTYFTQIDYGGSTLAQMVLPRFVLNKTGVQALKQVPGTFGNIALRNGLSNPLVQTVIGFSMLNGADALVYPHYQDYLASIYKEDLQKEIVKYPQLSAEKQKERELEAKAQGVPDARQVESYNKTLAGAVPQKGGSSVIFPIIALRRTLSDIGVGSLNTVTEQNKRDIAKAALQISYVEALKEKAIKMQQENEQNQKQMEEKIAQILQQKGNETAQLLDEAIEDLLSQSWVLDLKSLYPNDYNTLVKTLQDYKQSSLAIVTDMSLSEAQKSQRIAAKQKAVSALAQALGQKVDDFHRQQIQDIQDMEAILASLPAEEREEIQQLTQEQLKNSFVEFWQDYVTKMEKQYFTTYPALNNYPDLIDRVKATSHMYLSAKIATYGLEGEEAAKQQRLIDQDYADRMDEIINLLKKKEELLGGE